MEVEWVRFDCTKSKKELPRPLSHQSGGKFWVCVDGGVHGKRLDLCHWTGEKFLDYNNNAITHFAIAEFPEMPRDN